MVSVDTISWYYPFNVSITLCVIVYSSRLYCLLQLFNTTTSQRYMIYATWGKNIPITISPSSIWRQCMLKKKPGRVFVCVQCYYNNNASELRLDTGCIRTEAGYWMNQNWGWILDASELGLNTGCIRTEAGYWMHQNWGCILDASELRLDTGCIRTEAGYWIVNYN
jgi:hypothetical protein